MSEVSLYDKVQAVQSAKEAMPVSDQQFVEVIVKAVDAATLSGQVLKIAEGTRTHLDALHLKHVVQG